MEMDCVKGDPYRIRHKGPVERRKRNTHDIADFKTADRAVALVCGLFF